MLKEAFDTQPDNPQGTRKIGQFFRYIMYGWHQEQLTKFLVVEYVTKKLLEKEKKEKEKKAANEAKVGQVKVGMKKFMAQ
jgi:hypothetical protein